MSPAKSTSAKRNLSRRRPSVTFQTDISESQSGDAILAEIEGGEDEENTGENLLDVLDILQEYQKKKTSKSSTRMVALEAKKKSINDACNADIIRMKQEGAAYIEEIKSRVEELRQQEISPETTFSDVAALFAERTKGVETQLEILSHFLRTLSPARTELIEENSADLRSHPAQFEKTGKKIKKKAKKELQDGLEQQKLATEAQAYIKHYKHLIQI